VRHGGAPNANASNTGATVCTEAEAWLEGAFEVGASEPTSPLGRAGSVSRRFWRLQPKETTPVDRPASNVLRSMGPAWGQLLSETIGGGNEERRCALGSHSYEAFGVELHLTSF